MRRPGFLLLLLTAVAVLLAGCLPFLRRARIPMPTIELPSPDGDHRCLAVLLPGRWGGPDDFPKSGFAAAVQARGIDLDLVAVDAHLGYYRDRTILERLHEDVVLPARKRGYRELWMVGASLGGLGSLLYLKEHPEEVTGVFSLAPFLGEDELLDEVRAGGGPREWPRDEEGDFRELWSWIAGTFGEQEAPLVYLGFGEEDRFAGSSRLFAHVLPEERVLSAPGGHDWKVWGGLWGRFLDTAEPCAGRSE